MVNFTSKARASPRAARSPTNPAVSTAIALWEEPATIVFFDGGCPLCRREIRHYRRLRARSLVRWIDIGEDRLLLAELGISYAQAMRRLHVVDRRGRVVDGVRAFVAMWAELPGYRHLATLVRGSRALPVLERLYARFADRRYARRCDEARCPTSTGRHDCASTPAGASGTIPVPAPSTQDIRPSY